MASLFEDDCDLLIKNLPRELNNADKEDFLQYFGAKHVVCMGVRGKMKNTAFATFSNRTSAKQALDRLHQLDILGYKLVAEFAKKQHKTIASHEKSRLSPKQDDLLKKDSEMTEEPAMESQTTVTMSENSCEANKVSTKLGLNYERNSCLNYVYPPPNAAIITNIANALICVPKLYVQVLHLMNKLNLPAPFGIITPTPPFPNTAADNVISSSEESEIESDTESKSKRMKLNGKRGAVVERNKLKAKRLRVEPSQLLHPTTQIKLPSSKTIHKDVVSAFEQAVGIQQHSTKIKLADTISTIFETTPQITASKENNVTEEAISSGFGTFAPTEIEEENKREEDEELDEYDGEFVSLSELRKNKISREETKTLSAFKKYDCGEPTCRLYIKNLSKQVEVKDLTRVFGRFIDQTSEEVRQGFDVRLMKEGRMKGQAFVSFPDEKSAEKALKETHRYLLLGKPLVVQFARSSKPKD